MSDFPYFDELLGRFSGIPTVADVFSRHVHWGLFDQEDYETVSAAEFVGAAENMSRRLLKLSSISDGTSILDVGCGFGGTSEMLAATFPAAKICALNIDPRQIEKARQRDADGRITYVIGDACDMVFEDASFDRLIAVESVFHFP